MRLIIVTFLLFTSFFGVVSAQENENKWNYLGELYMMFPNMKGETTVGRLPAVELDAGAGDILGSLKMLLQKFMVKC